MLYIELFILPLLGWVAAIAAFLGLYVAAWYWSDILAWCRRRRGWRWVRGIRCQHCGYRRAGLHQFSRCPECGGAPLA